MVSSHRTACAALAGIALALSLLATVPAAASVSRAAGWRLSVLGTVTGYPVSQATAVSCASGACLATGVAAAVMAPETSNSGQPYFLATGSGGRWTPESVGPLPAGAPPWNSAESGANANGISCPARGSCVTVGVYSNSVSTSLSDPAFIAQQEHGTWRAFSPRLPSGAATPVIADLTSVSCASPGNCEAIGSYYTSRAEVQFSVTESAGRWARGWPMRLGRTAWQNGLQSLSCTRAADCVAVGSAPVDSGGPTFAIAALRVNGRWQQAARLRLPAGSGAIAGLRSVSCLPAGACTALGSRPDGTAVIVRFDHGRWGKPAPLTRMPAGAPRGSDVSLVAVSCARYFCLAAGSYYPAGLTHREWLVVRFVRGKWYRAAELKVPAGTSGTAGLETAADAVSCTLAGHCAVAGFYTNKSADQAALVATGSY